jgi:hypothetical protein
MMSWQYATGLVILVSPVWDLCMHGGQAAAGAPFDHVQLEEPAAPIQNEGSNGWLISAAPIDAFLCMKLSTGPTEGARE